jgi:hypothetical protein
MDNITQLTRELDIITGVVRTYDELDIFRKIMKKYDERAVKQVMPQNMLTVKCVE